MTTNSPATLDYRAILKNEFEARRRYNSSYSQRAFARDLGLAPTRVSDVLLRKQGLSPRLAVSVAKKLKLTAVQGEVFCALVQSEHARSRGDKEAARSKLESFRSNPDRMLTLELFHLIADWDHFAILELTRTKAFRSELKWISAQLKISVSEAETAIARLTKLGILREEKGKWVCTNQFVAAPSEVASAAIKKYHEQLLKRAAQALHEQAIEARDFSAVNVTVSPEQLPEIKKRIQKFRRELVQWIESKPERDHVYCLSTQLFALQSGPFLEEKDA
ncbi:DUF4423 domain-containing protein [Bdellovibrionota bacterium FG-2]